MRILLALLLVCFCASAQDAVWGRRSAFRTAPSSPAVTYLIEENCEGTGTPSGWTDVNSPNWDYTTVALQGSQSFNADSNGKNTSTTVADNTTAEAYCMFRFGSFPASTVSFFGFRNSSATPVLLVRMDATGHLSAYANGSDSTFTTDAMEINTTYHLWIRFVKNGTCTVAFSTDGTRPTSGTKFASKTGGNSAGDVVQMLRLQGIVSPSATIFDRILVSTGTIGDSP